LCDSFNLLFIYSTEILFKRIEETSITYPPIWHEGRERKKYAQVDMGKGEKINLPNPSLHPTPNVDTYYRK